MWSKTDYTQAAARGADVDILMYHSISGGGGATNIAVEVFTAQMEVLAASDVPVISLDDLVAARSGGPPVPSRSVIITFDDAFDDFARSAFPVLERLGLSSTVFVPTGRVGASETWAGASDPPRRLMDWSTIHDLAGRGICFGAHTVTHPDLMALSLADQRRELVQSKETLEDHLGRAVDHFAPPYGRASAETRRAIAAHFKSSCGTRLDRAGAESDLMDLPRLEMFYYQSPARFAAYLRGRGQGYLRWRQTLRGLRSAMVKPWAQGPGSLTARPQSGAPEA
ncbi:hypothetical protein AYJ57_13215 [Salipiger sp. CCB-MM3]|uniref:polysaccharide deacetylase family protein n=1 Tax=Salipiger sp. CCB-MM3 TaxID=1792508 RepID=UPI00080ABF99|nr:polysaccharide deacetylase family protein [Salipiger sp. CCB-MM3]ANT61245.1 hypothetical protein AYJ57_13215 [Salipiger sp. CCB-MM3]